MPTKTLNADGKPLYTFDEYHASRQLTTYADLIANGTEGQKAAAECHLDVIADQLRDSLPRSLTDHMTEDDLYERAASQQCFVYEIAEDTFGGFIEVDPSGNIVMNVENTSMMVDKDDPDDSFLLAEYHLYEWIFGEHMAGDAAPNPALDAYKKEWAREQDWDIDDIPEDNAELSAHRLELRAFALREEAKQERKARIRLENRAANQGRSPELQEQIENHASTSKALVEDAASTLTNHLIQIGNITQPENRIELAADIEAILNKVVRAAAANAKVDQLDEGRSGG